MRGRLQTKPGRSGAPAKRAPRSEEPRRSRASNVWMAPGARPVGKKKREAESEETAKPAKPRHGGPRSGGKAQARPPSSARPRGTSRGSAKGPKR